MVANIQLTFPFPLKLYLKDLNITTISKKLNLFRHVDTAFTARHIVSAASSETGIAGALQHHVVFIEGDMMICGVSVLTIFYCGDAVNKISTCGVAVISNPTVCEVCVFHAAVFGELKLFAVLGCFDLPLSNLYLA